MVITDLGVFEIAKHRPGAERHNAPSMTLVELAPGVSLDEIRAKTQATFDAGPGVN